MNKRSYKHNLKYMSKKKILTLEKEIKEHEENIQTLKEIGEKYREEQENKEESKELTKYLNKNPNETKNDFYLNTYERIHKIKEQQRKAINEKNKQINKILLN